MNNIKQRPVDFFMRHLLEAAIIVAVIFTIVGFMINPEEFGLHFIALIIEVALAVGVIDRLLRYRRQQEWKNVRGQIVMLLLNHLCSIGLEFSTCFTKYSDDYFLLEYAADIFEGHEKPNTKTEIAMHKMVDTMKKEIGPDVVYEDTKVIYAAISRDVEFIRSTLIPRMFAFATDEPEFVHSVCEIDYAYLCWDEQEYLDKIGFGHSAKAAENLLEKVAGAYSYLVRTEVKRSR